MFGFGKKPQKPEAPAKQPAKQPAQQPAQQPAKTPDAPAQAMKPLFDPPPPAPPQPVQQPAQQPAAQPQAAAAPAPAAASAASVVAPVASPSAAPSSAPAGGDWRSLSSTTFTAQELQLTQAQVDEAVMKARSESERGAPFGGALWGALNLVASNRQMVDDLIDELPNEAFGMTPSPHFGLIARCWSRAIQHESRPEHHTFKQLAMAAGWRPGDVNAARLNEALLGEPAFLSKTRHPLGLDLLPENLVLSPMETAVFQHMYDTFQKIEAMRKPESGSLQ